MDDQNPALLAARNSWRCVQSGNKEEWLSLLADDVVIEDPIGVSILDQTGKGHAGKQAASEFWDRNIAPNSIQIEPHESYTAASEAAHVLTLTTRLPAGPSVQVRGIFTYRVNAQGLIESLRGYWEMSDMRPL
jgi:steroid Delta-isomerase